MNRAADVVEVLSMQDVSAWERLAAACPDAFKTTGEVCSAPGDLGAVKQHTYYVQKRFAWKPDDYYSFADVFSYERSWHGRVKPATASLIMVANKPVVGNETSEEDICSQDDSRVVNVDQKPASRQSHSRNRNDRQASRPGTAEITIKPVTTVLKELVQPRTMQFISLMERNPLSQEGYLQLDADTKRWNDFRASRVQQINRFRVEDNRSDDELNKEDEIKKKIKNAYKLAKAAAEKKKQAEKSQANQLLTNAAHSALAEGDGDDDEEEEATVFDEDSSDDSEVDTEEAELRASFESYAEITDNIHVDADSNRKQGIVGNHLLYQYGKLPVSKLRFALIQILNMNVSENIVNETLELEGYYDNPTTPIIALDDFRHIYYW